MRTPLSRNSQRMAQTRACRSGYAIVDAGALRDATNGIERVYAIVHFRRSRSIFERADVDLAAVKQSLKRSEASRSSPALKRREPVHHNGDGRRTCVLHRRVDQEALS